MVKATARQREKLAELDIDFDDDITFAEAAELIRASLPLVQPRIVLNENALIEMSEVKAGDL